MIEFIKNLPWKSIVDILFVFCVVDMWLEGRKARKENKELSKKLYEAIKQNCEKK